MGIDSASAISEPLPSYAPGPAEMGPRRGFWRRRWRRVLAIFFFCYVTSYLIFSYRGRQESALLGIEGFFYLSPKNSRAWEIENSTLVIFYLPLNMIDQWVFGGSSGSAHAPLWTLGKKK